MVGSWGGGRLEGLGFGFWFWLAPGPLSLAWECRVYRQCLSRSSPRIIFVSAHVPGPPVLRTTRSGVLAGSCTCSPIMGEEPYYGGPLAELHLLQCRWHVHMVCWDCYPVVRAFSFLGYTRA